jgi:hypothetical protein
MTHTPAAEAELLTALRSRHEEFKSLFERYSSHNGFEDPIYRFYHQSFKVYHLQLGTQEIVRTLESLSPNRPLNPWFMTIVSDGTGHVFSPDDNQRWLPATRPILEAFFHARFFLEMAVRCAAIEKPPECLPSGYAALLYLYGLR